MLAYAMSKPDKPEVKVEEEGDEIVIHGLTPDDGPSG
jgi:hypothetical protein